MDYFEYLDSLAGKRICVIGLGVSNQPLTNALLDAGCDVTVCDRRSMEELGEAAEIVRAKGAKFCLGPDYLERLDCDVIFRSPSVLPIIPQLKQAADRGVIITSEMEAFCTLCPCRMIAVTGSDGKTTTSTVIAELLKAAGHTVHLGGNIGTPLFTALPTFLPKDFAVLELSSFQLHSMKCSPEIAVITNLSPNHLDVHSDYRDYVSAKQNVYRGQGADSVLVLNQKDSFTPEFYLEAPGQVRLFSSVGPVENGSFLDNGVVYWAKEGKSTPILNAADIRIPGAHNVENYMAAFAALQGIVSAEDCVQVARSFPGVPHRMEFVREVRGVRFYNDSIASSPTRTIAGLHAWPKPPIILLGGNDKHVPFEELGDELCQHAKAAVLCGQTADAIERAIRSSRFFREEQLPIIREDNFSAAVHKAYDLAESGDLVVLSPACSSFDQFRNFAERGDTFRAIVESLEE